VEDGRTFEDVGKEQGGLAWFDSRRPFRYSESIRDLGREEIGRQQLMNAVMEFVTKEDGLVGVDFATAHLKPTEVSITYFIGRHAFGG
jgi:hypothetical protein